MMRTQIVMPVIKKVAKELGLKLFIEPEYEFWGYIQFNSGKRFYFRDVNFNINYNMPAMLAKDKGFTSYFLKHLGYSVPIFKMVYSDTKLKVLNTSQGLFEGIKFANEIKYPVIIKPNSMSKGDYVFKVSSNAEFEHYMKIILSATDTAQVQKYYNGNDYRIVVLGEQIISVYQRIPFNVVGDGKSTINQLIDNLQKMFIDTARDTVIKKDDIRLVHKLQQQNLNMNVIPAPDEVIYLQDISNLSCGGFSVDLTDKLHPSYHNLAIKIAKDMDLSLCGIDIITNNIEEPITNDYVILEINSAPGIDNYVYSGLQQVEYTENLYKKILLYISSIYSND